MRLLRVVMATAAAVLLLPRVGPVRAHENDTRSQGLKQVLAEAGVRIEGLRSVRFEARLAGNNEVLPISTTGTGRFEALLVEEAGVIAFRLTYDRLEGGTAPSVAHVHFAPPRVNGGVMYFMCGGGGKPACPPQPATITGVVMAADVVGPNGQGIAPAEFAAAVRAMRAGLSYANVHSPTYPAGEIRGQLRRD